jgi:hypothetical protein
MRTEERRILKSLERKFYQLLEVSEVEKKKIANGISKYCGKMLSKYKMTENVEEVLVHCLDLDHWGWEEIPPTLTLEEIRKRFLPEIRSLLGKIKKKPS